MLDQFNERDETNKVFVIADIVFHLTRYLSFVELIKISEINHLFYDVVSKEKFKRLNEFVDPKNRFPIFNQFLKKMSKELEKMDIMDIDFLFLRTFASVFNNFLYCLQCLNQFSFKLSDIRVIEHLIKSHETLKSCEYDNHKHIVKKLFLSLSIDKSDHIPSFISILNDTMENRPRTIVQRMALESYVQLIGYQKRFKRVDWRKIAIRCTKYEINESEFENKMLFIVSFHRNMTTHMMRDLITLSCKSLGFIEKHYECLKKDFFNTNAQSIWRWAKYLSYREIKQRLLFYIQDDGTFYDYLELSDEGKKLWNYRFFTRQQLGHFLNSPSWETQSKIDFIKQNKIQSTERKHQIMLMNYKKFLELLPKRSYLFVSQENSLRRYKWASN